MSEDAAALSAMSSLSPEPSEVTSQCQQPQRPATKPSESWDVAFVYAFLIRFALLLERPTWPANIFQFEAAFLADYPTQADSDDQPPSLPAPRKTSRGQQTLTVPSGDAPSLVPVVEWLVDGLVKGHIPKPDSKKKGKRNFMLELSDLLMADLASPLRERWEGFNKLRHTAQGQVLRLDWQDRAIMLRSTCEWALNSSPYVRGQISSHYNLLPQRVVRRRPEENPLIIAPIGRDRNRNPYFRLDDTPRIYRAGSFYNANNYWEPITETAEDVARLATSFDAAASTGKKAAGNTKTPELERAFKKHLQTEVIPNLGLSEERLRMLSRTYNEWIKAEQRAARQERAHVEQSVEPEPLPVADDISAASANGSRRAAAKRINYKDVEDGRLTDAASETAKRGKKRGRASELSELDDDSNNRRSSRTNKGAAPSRFGAEEVAMVKAEEELNRRRSSRNSRGAKNEEEDAVALVQAYLNAELAKNEEDAEANAMDVDGEASLDPQPAVHPGEPSEASVLDAMEGAAVSKVDAVSDSAVVQHLQEDEVGEKEPSRPSETIEEPTVEKNAVVEPSADEVPSQVTATAAPDTVPTEASTSAASVAVPGST